jgi:hypothetical protein
MELIPTMCHGRKNVRDNGQSIELSASNYWEGILSFSYIIPLKDAREDTLDIFYESE